MTIHNEPTRLGIRNELIRLQLRLQRPQFPRLWSNAALIHNLQANPLSVGEIPSGDSGTERAGVELAEKLERSKSLGGWSHGRQTSGRPVKTPGPPRCPVWSGYWRVCQSRALERKTDALDGRGTWWAARTNGWVRGVVTILILVWKPEHRTHSEAPPFLDAWLDHSTIVVDALSADDARSERHVQIVKSS